MPTPAKALNAADPSGLRRTEDRRAAEMQADLERLIRRVLDRLSPDSSPMAVQRIVDAELAGYSSGTRQKVIEWVQDTEQRSVLRGEQLLKASGVSIGARLGPRELPKDLRERIEINIANEIDSLTADVKKALTRSLIDGMEAGEGSRVLTKRLQEDLAMPRVRADLIARTETMRAYNDASKAQYERYGIKRVEWLAAIDERTCPTCGALNGRQWPIDKAPPCPAHPRCRCVLLPCVDRL